MLMKAGQKAPTRHGEGNTHKEGEGVGLGGCLPGNRERE